MPEFLLCSTSCRRDSIERELGVPPDQLCDPYSPREKSVSYVQAYRPYMLLDSGINLRMTHGYYQGASPIYHASGYVQQNIFDLVQRYGQDATLGLATIMNDKVSGGLNSSAEVMGKRLDHFSKAIQEYQAALLKLRDAYQLPEKQLRAPPARPPNAPSRPCRRGFTASCPCTARVRGEGSAIH